MRRSSGGPVFLHSLLEHYIVANECEESPASLVGRSVCSYRTEPREGWCGIFRQEFRLLNEADVNAVIVESESWLMLFSYETVWVPLK